MFATSTKWRAFLLIFLISLSSYAETDGGHDGLPDSGASASGTGDPGVISLRRGGSETRPLASGPNAPEAVLPSRMAALAAASTGGTTADALAAQVAKLKDAKSSGERAEAASTLVQRLGPSLIKLFQKDGKVDVNALAQALGLDTSLEKDPEAIAALKAAIENRPQPSTSPTPSPTPSSDATTSTSTQATRLSTTSGGASDSSAAPLPPGGPDAPISTGAPTGPQTPDGAVGALPNVPTFDPGAGLGAGDFNNLNELIDPTRPTQPNQQGLQQDLLQNLRNGLNRNNLGNLGSNGNNGAGNNGAGQGNNDGNQNGQQNQIPSALGQGQGGGQGSGNRTPLQPVQIPKPSPPPEFKAPEAPSDTPLDPAVAKAIRGGSWDSDYAKRLSDQTDEMMKQVGEMGKTEISVVEQLAQRFVAKPLPSGQGKDAAKSWATAGKGSGYSSGTWSGGVMAFPQTSSRKTAKGSRSKPALRGSQASSGSSGFGAAGQKK